MSAIGTYLYGFTNRGYSPAPSLRGLAGEPVRAVTFRDVSAVVSRHSVQRLAPRRSNLEPHHRVVRHISHVAAVVPAAFGHISETEQDIVDVLRHNYDDIRGELARLDGKCEMSVKLSWTVENIFDYFVRHDRELQALRDQLFRGRQPTVAEKLQLGGKFEAALTRERDRLTRVLLRAFSGVAGETLVSPVRTETTVCSIAMLVDRAAQPRFEAALRQAATVLDQNYTLDYSGPWPAYSFVRLRLQLPNNATVA
jgi:hypothetical protein